MEPATEELLNDLFTYHKPTPEQQTGYNRINDAAKQLARVIIEECPNSADKSTALRTVRLARMWANSSIACQGKA